MNTVSKKSILLKGYSYSKEEAHAYNKENKLLLMRVETHAKCNLRCAYCYGAKDHNRVSIDKEMPFPKLKYVIDEAAELGLKSISYISGGEPFLYKHFWPFMEYLFKKDIIPAMFTNSTLINDDIAKRLYDLNVTPISKFDAFSKEKQELLTGPGSYDKMKKGIDCLLNAGFNNLVDGYTRIGAGVCLCRDMVNEVPDIWRYCRNNNIFPNVDPITSYTDATAHFVITKEQSNWLRTTLKGIDKNEYGIEWLSQIYTPIIEHSCWALVASCTIKANGNVIGCPDPKSQVFGNIYEKPLKEILQAEHYLRCRNFHKTIGEPCKSCADLSICAGGCRSRALEKFGDEFGIDPYCPRNTNPVSAIN